MKTDTVTDRIDRLRSLMAKEGIDIYLITDSDYHNSEYIGDFFKCREYMSGFTGSNGQIVVTGTEALLWTDGRYFIQAASELENSGIILMKMGEPGVPTIREYITEHIKEGDTLGFDGRVVSAKSGIAYEKTAAAHGARIRCDLDLVGEIWPDRPGLVSHPVMVLDDKTAGETVDSKLRRVRERIAKEGACGYVLSSLDDICWLLNIRGNDIECTPVVLSFLYLDSDSVHLFINDSALTDEADRHFMNNRIQVHGYNDFIPFLDRRAALLTESPGKGSSLLADLNRTNYAVYNCINQWKRESGGQNPEVAAASNLYGAVSIIDKPDPTREMEAVRNEVQLELIRRYYIQDSAVLTRFLYQLKKEVKNGKTISEYDAAMRLDRMREDIPGFIELSFPTISAYGANAAMMHYEAKGDDSSVIKPEGMYLVDSGGQYLGATTDVTRTIAVGEVTDEMKRDYTLTCVGMLRLADAVFLEGCTGRNLDILARGELWKRGIDYKCGTGHGVGYILGVHTGPQNIRNRYNPDMTEAVLKAGMTVSDEPGIYIQDKYGIRIENILEIGDAFTNSDGHFLRFEHLTWVPLDPELIDVKYMEPSDIKLLNAYNTGVYERLKGIINDDEESKWLRTVTQGY